MKWQRIVIIAVRHGNQWQLAIGFAILQAVPTHLHPHRVLLLLFIVLFAILSELEDDHEVEMR